MVIRSIAICMISILLINGCKKSDTVGPMEVAPHTDGVYVLNEGNFGKPNSSVTFYVPDSNKAYQDILNSIGDTGNDIVVSGSKGFIVVNNSNKVIVFSIENNSILGTIQLPNKSPRQIAVVNDTKAYVTNWNDNSVAVINPETFSVTKEAILVGSAPEGIAVVNGKVYVCNYGYGSDSTVSVIDVTSDKVVKTVVVGTGPQSVGIDGDGDVIVECSGYTDWNNSANDTPGSIVSINSTTDIVTSIIPLSLTLDGHPSEIAVSKNGYAFVTLKNGIGKIDTRQNTIVNNSFIATISAYSIAVDDATDNLYVADPKDYVQDGIVRIYDNNGIQTGSFGTGLIPGDIAFKH